jgi:peptidoglycan/LPS O-acetylase OafA/YrhL
VSDTRNMSAELTPDHLWQIDIVRLLSFTAVIAVHSIVFTQQPSNQVAAGAMMLLQFGRETFFAITGFVLIHSTRRRYHGALRFWRRRLPAVLLAYLTWTAIYYAYTVLTAPSGQASWSALARDVATGGAEYHLYFLLVTMQLYLAWPLLLPMIRRAATRPWILLAGVGVVNLIWLAALQYVAAPTGWTAFFWQRGYELLPTYAIYVVAGSVVAIHLDRVQSFVHRHGRALIALGTLAGALATVAYAVQLGGRAPRDAAAVLQPAMVLTSFGAALILYVAGSRWAAGRRRLEPAVRTASDVSFAVYLAHPLVLAILLRFGLGIGGQRLPSPVATVLGFAGATAGALVIGLAARRSPLAPLLAGRPRRRAEPKPIVREAVPVLALASHR